LGAVVWLKLPQVLLRKVPQVLLRAMGGLIHQALASRRRHDPQQREGSGVSGF
jgi:hypothetical protein